MTSSFHSDTDAFLSALIAVLLISVIPFLILFLLFQCRPRSRSASSKSALLSDSALRIFVSFAVGGLLGDAFLHLVPHAINPHSHSDTAASASPLVHYLTAFLPAHHTAATATTAPSNPAPFTLPPTSTASHAHDHSHHDHSHDHSQDHSHDHSHDHTHDHAHGRGHESDHVHGGGSGMTAGLLVLAGMGIFFVVEKVARLRAGPDADEHAGHSHSHGGRSHAHEDSHSHAHAKQPDSSHVNHDADERQEVEGAVEVNGPAAAVLQRRRGKDGHVRSSLSPSKSPSPIRRTRSQSRNTTHTTPPSDSTTTTTTPVPSTTPASHPQQRAALTGLLNLLADLSHNFTDGLAITASFLQSPALGVSTALAVLVHEVPHELGDFAILLQAGFSLQQAMWMQLVTAVGAVVGVVVMWLSGGRGEGAGWVLPVTAGGFVYVALVNVVPGLLNEQTGADRPVGMWRWVQLAAEMSAMLVGVGLMVALGEME